MNDEELISDLEINKELSESLKKASYYGSLFWFFITISSIIGIINTIILIIFSNNKTILLIILITTIITIILFITGMIYEIKRHNIIKQWEEHEK